MSEDDELKKQEQFLQMMEEKKNKQVSTEVVKEQEKKENFDQEYEFARDQMVDLAEMGKKALEQLEEVVSETNEPRAYRVFAELLSANKDIINSIMDNAKKKADIAREKQEQKKMVGELDKPASITNNTTVFVGTTKDLLQRIAEEEKAQNKIIEGEVKEVK